jgi:ABC-2 type transport system permease protein
VVAGRRDLGSALVRGGAGPTRASSWLRSPVGLAAAVHRPTFLGWLAGALILAALMGALAQQFIDAVLGNPTMAAALGLANAQPADGIVAITQLYIAILATAFTVQAVGTVRSEETAGRLEVLLAGTLSRAGWLAAQTLVILIGLGVMVLASSVVLAAGMAWSMGITPDLPRLLGAGLAYLPAELLVGGVALALFGIWPRALPLAWAAVAGVAFIALLGPALQLPAWVLNLSPTSHVGNPPLGTVQAIPLLVLSVIAALVISGAFMGFGTRGVPQR